MKREFQEEPLTVERMRAAGWPVRAEPRQGLVEFCVLSVLLLAGLVWRWLHDR